MPQPLPNTTYIYNNSMRAPIAPQVLGSSSNQNFFSAPAQVSSPTNANNQTIPAQTQQISDINRVSPVQVSGREATISPFRVQSPASQYFSQPGAVWNQYMGLQDTPGAAGANVDARMGDMLGATKIKQALPAVNNGSGLSKLISLFPVVAGPLAGLAGGIHITSNSTGGNASSSTSGGSGGNSQINGGFGGSGQPLGPQIPMAQRLPGVTGYPAGLGLSPGHVIFPGAHMNYAPAPVQYVPSGVVSRGYVVTAGGGGGNGGGSDPGADPWGGLPSSIYGGPNSFAGSNSYGGNGGFGNNLGSNSFGTNSGGTNSLGSNSYGTNSYGSNTPGQTFAGSQPNILTPQFANPPQFFHQPGVSGPMNNLGNYPNQSASTGNGFMPPSIAGSIGAMPPPGTSGSGQYSAPVSGGEDLRWNGTQATGPYGYTTNPLAPWLGPDGGVVNPDPYYTRPAFGSGWSNYQPGQYLEGPLTGLNYPGKQAPNVPGLGSPGAIAPGSIGDSSNFFDLSRFAQMPQTGGGPFSYNPAYPQTIEPQMATPQLAPPGYFNQAPAPSTGMLNPAFSERPYFANQRVSTASDGGGEMLIPSDGGGMVSGGSIGSPNLPFWFNPVSTIDRFTTYPIQQALGGLFSSPAAYPASFYPSWSERNY